jgi:hypothetical protein
LTRSSSVMLCQLGQLAAEETVEDGID